MPTAFVIDDNHHTAETLSTFLQSCGYTAECFTDLKTAEHKILRDHPCIVIVDYYVSDEISTPEFIERIRAHHPNLKIVIISGDARKHIEASRLGADFLLKPVDVNHLERICECHCGGR